MSENLKDVTDTNFEAEVLKAKEPVLVDFWAEWCAPCRMMTPIIETLATNFAGRAKIVKLNVDDNPSVTQRYGIKGIPTLILFKDGKEAERVVGATNESGVAGMLEENLRGAAA